MLKPSSMCLSRTRRVRRLPRPAMTGLVLAALLVAAPVAHALSLGRMNVMSALGEPLRAEIDVTSLSADQVASLQIGLASPEVYRAAGMEFSELLRGTRVTLARRADGRQVLQVTSDRAARDPFVDLILQATWANGRLVREYTVLLDPPRRDVPTRDEDRLVTSSGIESDAESALPVPAAGATVAQVPVAPDPAVRPPPAPQPSSPTTTSLGRPSASASAPASAPASRAASPASTTPSAPASRVDTSSPPASGRPTSTRPTPPAAPDRTLSSAPAAPRTPAARQSDAETPAKAPARAAAAPRSRPATISGRYTVRSGDTLYRIARDARPETVSLDQMLVALYRSNPRAFTGDNMNRLLAGAVLTLPDAAEAARVPPEDARRVIQAHSSDMLAYRQKLAERAGLIGEGSATRASGRVEALVQDRRRPAVSSPDQLKLSQAAVAGRANPEAVLSDRAATLEAQRREAEIQRNVETLRQLEAESKEPAVSLPGGGGAGSSALVGTGASKPEEGSASFGPQLAAPAAAAAAAAAGPSASDPSALADPAASSDPPAADLAESDSPMLAMYGLAAGGALGTMLLALAGARLLRRNKQRDGSALLGEREAIEPSGDLPDVPELNATPMSFDEAVAQRMAEAPEFDPDSMGEERHADPVAEADVYIAYGRLQQAEALLRAALQAEPHRLDIQVKLLEVHAFQKDLAAFDAQAEILYEVTGGQGPEWTRALALRRALVAPPAAPSRVESAPVSRAVKDDVDLAFPADPERTLASTLDAKELASMAASATQRPAEAGASLPPRPLRPVVEPTLGPEPRSVEAADFSLDLDLLPSSRPPRPRQDIDLGDDPGQSGGPGVADPDAGDPLDRKLALAEEFIQIGDVEGARDLLGEVGAKGDGPLKERAQRLLRTLG